MSNTTSKLVELIKDAVENSMEEISLRTDYSGRGMFGEKCIAVVGSDSACRAVIAEVIKEAHSRASDDDLEFDHVVDIMLDYSTDNMGRYDIVMYWRGVEASEDSEPEDDGQPDEAQEWHDFDPDC